MQLKLLNFHRMLASFAVNLIGGFVSLIIYEQSASLFFAILYLIINNAIVVGVSLLLKKQYVKRPQLMLLFRIFTITGYAISVGLLQVMFIPALVLTTIFAALDSSISLHSPDMIFNYAANSAKGNSKAIAITRVFSNLGVIIAMLLGGLFLDSLDLYIIIIITLCIYFISVIPLVWFYKNSRKSRHFNKEQISTAMMYHKQSEVKNKKGKKLCNKILFGYTLVYFLISFIDMFTTTFNLHSYLTSGLYAYAGIFAAVYTGSKIISNYLVSKLITKYDLTVTSIVSAVVVGVCVIFVPHLNNFYIQLAFIAVIGFAYEIFSVFVFDRMIIKTRILGISNRALFLRQTISSAGKGFAIFFAILGPLNPVFYVMAAGMIAAAIFMPLNEEKSRKAMIKYLENND